MRIAIGFFGQVKNFTNQLYDSFIESVCAGLHDHYIDYYLVTYNNSVYYNPSTGENHNIDYCSILEYFDFTDKIFLDTKSETTKEIDLFVSNTLNKYGYHPSWGFNAKLSTIHSLRQLYSLYSLGSRIQSKYDKYILCRPDCIFENILDSELLYRSEDICVPNFSHWSGYNDRFAVLNDKGLQTYCGRYNSIRSVPMMYHSERYLKHCADKLKNTVYLFNNFKFRLLRADGKLSRPDY